MVQVVALALALALIPSVGHAITLQDLMVIGDPFYVGDKVFTGFGISAVESGGSTFPAPVDSSNIDVIAGLPPSGGFGLQFQVAPPSSFGFQAIASGSSAFLNFVNLSFDVTPAFSPTPMLLTGFRLFGTNATTTLGSSISISGFVSTTDLFGSSQSINFADG
jgi:hypothetical protein